MYTVPFEIVGIPFSQIKGTSGLEDLYFECGESFWRPA